MCEIMAENKDTIEHRALCASLLNIVYRSLRNMDCISSMLHDDNCEFVTKMPRNLWSVLKYSGVFLECIHEFNI
jgi:hypothetical protein